MSEHRLVGSGTFRCVKIDRSMVLRIFLYCLASILLDGFEKESLE